jgi:isopentenyldiphosphate isomerase
LEQWEIYDRAGNPTGKIVNKKDGLGKNEYHLAVEIWVINDAGEILLQQRSASVELLPGLWGLTTGRVQAGETSLQAAVRELQEEMGILLSEDALQFIERIPRDDETHLIWDIFVAYQEIPIETVHIQKEEVAAARYVTPKEFSHMIKKGEIYEYPEIHRLLAMLTKKELT